MRVGAIIFSRMSSGRLPGKAMVDISGKTLLHRVIERTKSIKLIDHMCVATSLNPEDDIIESTANSFGIDIYRGSLNDVADRAFNAANKFGYDHFLRVCGDRPFLDYKIYDELISNHIKDCNDLTTNIFPRKVPPGLTGEVINVKALEKLLSLTENQEDREHVTRYFYQNSSDFKIQNVASHNFNNIDNVRLVIDDEKDLSRAEWILKKIKQNGNVVDIQEIISLARLWKKNN